MRPTRASPRLERTSPKRGRGVEGKEEPRERGRWRRLPSSSQKAFSRGGVNKGRERERREREEERLRLKRKKREALVVVSSFSAVHGAPRYVVILANHHRHQRPTQNGETVPRRCTCLFVGCLKRLASSTGTCAPVRAFCETNPPKTRRNLPNFLFRCRVRGTTKKKMADLMRAVGDAPTSKLPASCLSKEQETWT